MSDETAPFTWWLDEFNGFLRDSYQKGLLFIPKIVPKRYRNERVKLDKRGDYIVQDFWEAGVHQAYGITFTQDPR